MKRYPEAPGHSIPIPIEASAGCKVKPEKGRAKRRGKYSHRIGLGENLRMRRPHVDLAGGTRTNWPTQVDEEGGQERTREPAESLNAEAEEPSAPIAGVQQCRQTA